MPLKRLRVKVPKSKGKSGASVEELKPWEVEGMVKEAILASGIGNR